jgi:glycosyltransferase involved in cell wall biosynthesis
MIKEIYSEFGFNENKMTVIPQPVNIEFIKSSQRPGENLIKGHEGKFNILYVGRLEYNKGVDLLIDAISRINLPDICLHIVGEGNEKEKLENLARRLNVAEKVNFYGYIQNEHLPQFYSNAHVFVHPSRWPEPMGRTILEAMSFGMPLIVSGIGAPKWLSKDASLSFEPGNITQLSKRIMELYSDNNLRKRLSKNAKDRVKEFDCRKTIKKLIGVYNEVK